MNTGLTHLGNILGNDSHFNPEHFLYLPMDQIWQLDTKCAVIPVSDLDGIPTVIQQNGLSCALEIAAVQGVVSNAKEQTTDVSIDQLLEAFLFYYDHDAFITLNQN